MPRSIGFFGGEPLLAASRPVVDYIMRRARERGPASFWAITNATELAAYEDVLSPQGISQLQITLDGPPSEHDRRRVYPDGEGTFELISRNIDMALEREVAVSIRLNVDRNNLDQLPELAETFQQRGWSRHGRFSSYAAPITSSSGALEKRHLLGSWALSQAIRRLRAEFPSMHIIAPPDEGILQHTRRIFEEKNDLDPIIFSKASFCGAHTGMYIFDAFGDIYACWEKTGDSRIRIGHVTPDGIEINEARNRQWRARTVTSNPVCRECRYALHCGGGCAVLAEAKNGGFFTNHCDGYAQRFRAAVALAYQQYVRGESSEVKHERVCDL